MATLAVPGAVLFLHRALHDRAPPQALFCARTGGLLHHRYTGRWEQHLGLLGMVHRRLARCPVGSARPREYAGDALHSQACHDGCDDLYVSRTQLSPLHPVQTSSHQNHKWC